MTRHTPWHDHADTAGQFPSHDTRPVISQRGWHRPDLLSLGFGLLFIVIGASTLLPGAPALWDVRELLLPVIAVMVGLIILARVVQGARDSGRTRTASSGTPSTSGIPGPHDPVPSPAKVAEEDRRWLDATEGLSEAEREVLQALRDAEKAAPSSADADQPDRDEG